MDATPLLPPDEARLRAINEAVVRVEEAENALQEAVDTAREAGDPDDAIAFALAARDSGVRSIVRALVAALGPAFVAALAGATSKQHVTQWAEPDGPPPGPQAERRLRLAHKVWCLLVHDRGDEVARSWFLTANPDLGGDSPLAAIKRDRVREVMAAVDAVLEAAPDPTEVGPPAGAP